MTRIASNAPCLLFVLAALGLVSAPGCGPGVDREETLTRLRAALTEDIPDDDPSVLQDHNELVVTVREGAVLNGMRRHEVQEALGRGTDCGPRALCAEHGFSGNDWYYEVGQRDGEAWGPTIIVGFGQQGIVEHVYTLTRN